MHSRLKRHVHLLPARTNVAMTAGVCAGYLYSQRIHFVTGVPAVITSSLTGMGRGLPHVSAGFLRAGCWCLGLGRPGGSSIPPAVLLPSPSGISQSRRSGQTYPASRRDPRQRIWHYRVRTREAKRGRRQRRICIRRIERNMHLAQRRMILFFCPILASSANQIFITARSVP